MALFAHKLRCNLCATVPSSLTKGSEEVSNIITGHESTSLGTGHLGQRNATGNREDADSTMSSWSAPYLYVVSVNK